jgi:hypothetical protein
MSHYRQAYRIIFFGILCLMSIHAANIFSSEREIESCSCHRDVAKLEYPLSTPEQKIVEVLAQLPIAIPSGNKGASYPLIKLICEYSPWFLVTNTDFPKCWITQNGVNRPATGCNHVRAVALNYAWKAAGSGRICDLWYYLGGKDVVFNRDDIVQLEKMTLLRNDAQEHERFEFASVCDRYRNIYTQGIGFEQFSKIDVVPHIQACLKTLADKKQKEDENVSCSIL